MPIPFFVNVPAGLVHSRAAMQAKLGIKVLGFDRAHLVTFRFPGEKACGYLLGPASGVAGLDVVAEQARSSRIYAGVAG
jgi:hypothetical protein